MRVAFRVDAGPCIGTGHWMRCLALSQALRERGAEMLFISRQPPTSLVDLLPPLGIGLELLPPAMRSSTLEANAPAHAAWLAADPIVDARMTSASIEHRLGQADWLIVDHYGIDARWHQAARLAGTALMAIDDLADRALAVDLVLDQAYRHGSGDYRDRLQRPAPVLPGVGHALLRDEFARARDAALARRVSSSPVRRVLISFGGVDAANHAESALRALAQDPSPPLDIDLVMGAAPRHGDAIERQANTHPHRVAIVRAAPDMARRMSLADVAFGACGSTSWERCCLGLPTIAIAVADNQRDAAAALSRTGSALIVDPAQDPVTAFAEHWRRLRDDAALRQRMSRSAAGACDGEGARRVVEAMSRLRQERMADA